MRELKLPGKQFYTTKTFVEALAWASNRRGNNPWLSPEGSMSSLILGYLESHDVVLARVYKPSNAIYILRKLVEYGFASIKEDPVTKRITWFRFDPDVILTGYMPEFKKGTPEVTQPGNPTISAKLDSLIIKGQSLPLPKVPVVRYLKDDINTLLDAFAEADPDGYAEYAESLYATLKGLYG